MQALTEAMQWQARGWQNDRTGVALVSEDFLRGDGEIDSIYVPSVREGKKDAGGHKFRVFSYGAWEQACYYQSQVAWE